MNDNNEICDTLKAAKTYLDRLKKLSYKIQNAERQICDTSQETESNVEKVFNTLLASFTQTLLHRRDNLIKKVHQLKLQSLTPLQECQIDLSNKIEKTHKLIIDGEQILNNANKNVKDFTENSSLLGSLPEIPELKEVPYITFQYASSLESELLDIGAHFGKVQRIAPVQISQITENPGALLVEWQGSEYDDRIIDIQEFRLQRAYGDATVERHLIASFSDCFVGSETQFLVKELQVNQPYSFRVCCKFEGSNEWSQWSLLQTAHTSIKPFSWANNQDFLLANDNKIATPLKDVPSLLISDGHQFAVGYCIEFTYLEFDDKTSTIGLIGANHDSSIKDIKSMQHNYFALDSSGEIFVNGVKKSTKLPKATKGLKVSFTCEQINGDKLRINIDSCNKRVTYDWQVSKISKMYFAALLKSQNSKIMIE